MLLSSNMEKEVLCKNILRDLKKQDVGVKVSQDIKGNYYSYIHNCIYLNSNNTENIQDKAKECVVVAHECIHATQSKALHITNVILSNLEILLFIVFVIVRIAFKSILPLKLVYVTICVLSLICRCILEIPAMINSFELARKYCNNEINEVIQKDKKSAKKLLPLGILSISWFKIIRLILVFVI